MLLALVGKEHDAQRLLCTAVDVNRAWLLSHQRPLLCIQVLVANRVKDRNTLDDNLLHNHMHTTAMLMYRQGPFKKRRHAA